MDIKITPQLLASSPTHQQLALYAIMNGSSTRWQGNGTIYGLDADGEMLVQPEHLPLFAVEGITVDQGEFYVEMPADEYNSFVDSSFPEFEATAEDSTIIQRAWSGYAPFATPSADGKSFLVRCVKVPFGQPSGQGLTKEEFPVWCSYFAGRILTKAQGMSLMASSKYAQPAVI